jgi:hypothetical protein
MRRGFKSPPTFPTCAIGVVVICDPEARWSLQLLLPQYWHPPLTLGHCHPIFLYLPCQPLCKAMHISSGPSIPKVGTRETLESTCCQSQKNHHYIPKTSMHFSVKLLRYCFLDGINLGVVAGGESMELQEFSTLHVFKSSATGQSLV